MTEYRLRYFEKEAKYYIEIRDEAYFELDKRIRRLKREAGLSGGTRAKNAVSPEARIALLTAKKESAKKYVCIAEGDIPPGVKARPMFKLQGEIIKPEPTDYQQFITLLAKKHIK